MARIMYRRNRIDPTKISGPYSLLAVMLLVAEILFAIWFYRAENSVERSIAGLIMAVFFVCLMLLIMKINRNPDKEKARRMVNDMTDIFQDYEKRINLDDTHDIVLQWTKTHVLSAGKIQFPYTLFRSKN